MVSANSIIVAFCSDVSHCRLLNLQLSSLDLLRFEVEFCLHPQTRNKQIGLVCCASQKSLILCHIVKYYERVVSFTEHIPRL
jgi:hypothetical protein